MRTRTLHPSPLRKYICNPVHPLIGGIGVLTIAIILALTACGEKKKPDGGESKIDYGSLTDSRDGKAYKTVKIGEQVWMAENLNYNAEGSKCYDNEPANCEKYGRLYNWETALKACPPGWHLHSQQEWDTLVATAGGNLVGVAGKKLKSKTDWKDNGNGTDDYGFTAMAGGGGDSDGGFYHVGFFGFWWSSSTSEDNSNAAKFTGLHYNYEGAGGYDSGGKSDLYSVRCVKD